MLIKIKNILISIIYVLVLVYLLIFIPSFWGHKPLVVISSSMEPTLKVGSLLYYHEQELDKFNKDDILVYYSKHHIISHRLVERVDGGFITKGDANPSNDSLVINNSQVLGKGTQWCIPYLGLYADFIYTHKYILVVTIVILIIDLYFDYRRKRRIKNDEKEI